MNITKETKLLLIVLAITLGLAALCAVVADDSDSDTLTMSTYSARSGGAKATFLLIHELGYSVERWSSSPQALPENTEGTLLIVMNPQRVPSDEERIALNRFIAHGGTLLIAGEYSVGFIPDQHASYDFPSKSWHNFAAMVPQPLNRGVASITMPKGTSWQAGKDDLPLYGEGDKAMAVTVTLGQGRIVWLSSPVPLSNAGLQAQGNAEFLGNVLAVTGSQRVLWDLYFSENAPGKRSPFKTPALLAAGAQLLFIFGLVVWTNSRRSGPVRAFNTAPEPMSQMEFVKTLGSLYESAEATNVAVQIAYARFAFLASRRFGLASTDVNNIGEAVAAALGEPQREVVDFLTECDNIQHHGQLTQPEAIERVQRLHAYATKLKLTPNLAQEKH